LGATIIAGILGHVDRANATFDVRAGSVCPKHPTWVDVDIARRTKRVSTSSTFAFANAITA
jgi:hypothetical protein